MSEILITFAVLARRFRFRLVPDQRIEPIAWTSLRPGRGIHMRVEKRSRSGAARENSADAAAAAGGGPGPACPFPAPEYPPRGRGFALPPSPAVPPPMP